jgi:hypothetical protein
LRLLLNSQGTIAFFPQFANVCFIYLTIYLLATTVTVHVLAGATVDTISAGFVVVGSLLVNLIVTLP